MADLSDAHLDNANLCNATLMHTNLSGAVLTGAQFHETNVINCNIASMKCKYITIGLQKKERFPANRDFTPEDLESIFIDQSLINEEFMQDFNE